MLSLGILPEQELLGFERRGTEVVMLVASFQLTSHQAGSIWVGRIAIVAIYPAAADQGMVWDL